ncbi:SDR family NAD(P)-dependent oxidoreductase [Halosegnis longus]|uniref:Glucose 1-dehydrogenase n=1 Tax=Halosegnis longus TaxID=2216012 RepID=A0AAJ4R9D5_9EURY|nr:MULTISPECIES: glucose 1-dehydrogenase [Halobacteriales]RNJ26561.1 glucose 1-dehydrogenase [Salella cibi]
MGTVSYDFDGETVVVTGGASGIGRAAAVAFAGAGASVVVADIREEPKDRDATTPTHDLITDTGGEATFVETDVSTPDDVRDAVERAREYGGVDVMVNNAGVNRHGHPTDLDAADLDAMYEVNVRGVHLGTQIAAEDMLDRDAPGCIVNTASISSNDAQHGQVGYDATKGAIRMHTRTAALDLADDGIRVNAVAPGQIATEFSEGWTEEAETGAREDDLLKPVPLGRAGHPEDVAPAFLWLASEAAGYVTGELLHVDGGWQVS